MSPSEYDGALAAYVRSILAWHGLRQADLARILGCSQQGASQKISGVRRFTLDDVRTFAAHFDIEPGLMLNPPGFERGLLTWTFKQFPLVRALFLRAGDEPANSGVFPQPRAA